MVPGWQSIGLAFCIVSGHVSAETKVWGSAESWDILIDVAAKNSCYATRTTDDQSTVFIGFENGGAGGYFAVYNPAWTEIDDGQKGLVEFDFSEEIFAGEAVGKYRNGVPGRYAFFNNPAFADAFARYEQVKITGSKEATFSMVLTGTHRAVASVRECQSAQGTRAAE
ncbi:hypothetical protein [Ruegeria profundi]|uniref:Uncharacterized protein n=1 Tax=Ruegeria profundi TaxID=1685378 RepID=A0A0X3TXG0_9RHOB|nr:hypothetical protein [Ruegeria profundi]KUJ79236.1 hypothetical protein AVO44_08335 [Ruegeria profundi]